MIHCMIDIETLGTAPGSVILSIGAVKFDPGASEPFDAFYRNIHLQSSLDAGLTVCGATIEWWFKQSDGARTRLFENVVPLGHVLWALTSWYESAPKAKAIWSHGSSFDLVLLRVAGTRVGWLPPWHYRDERDTRTLFDVSGRSKGPADEPGIEHDALYDATIQARWVQSAYARLRKEKVWPLDWGWEIVRDYYR